MKKLFSILTIIVAIVLQANAQTAVEKHWTCNPHQFPNNMTIVGMVQLDGEELLTETMEIGAFHGEECRGSEILRYYPNVDRYLVFLTVYGTLNDEILFRMYDHTTEEEVIAESTRIAFVDNAIIGNPGEPYIFDFSSEVTWYNIQANALPEFGGTVIGTDAYQYGRTCTLTAEADEGFQFNYWLKDGSQVSNNPSYSFMVTEEASYFACFREQHSYSPHWQPNAHQYENNMTMIGLVQVDGDELLSEIYEIGAFCGDECRGSAFLQYQPLYDRYLVYMTVSGQEGDKIKFRLYDHQQNQQVDRITASIRFVSNTHYGTPDDPYIYFFTTYLTFTTDINPKINYNCGYATGGGQFLPDDSCTLVATPYENYVFMYWTENGQIISNEAEYSFEVTRSMDLVANFSAYLPELHVTSVSHSDFMGGQTASVSWTVQNDGIHATPVGAVWYDRVYLSLENEISSSANGLTLLGEFPNLAALEPGEYYTQTKTFTLPLRISGQYYLFVITDSQLAYNIEWENGTMELPYTTPPFIVAQGYPNRVFEMSEFVRGSGQQNTYYHDNFFYDQVDIAVPPLPDLQVTNILAPTDFYSGTNISVTATISNMGENRTQVTRWTDYLFVSDTSVYIPSRCTFIDSKYHNGYLYPDSTYQQVFYGRVPVTMFGEAYFFVYTDYYQQNYEHIMSNNNVAHSNPVNIILTPPADLVPVINSYPQTVSTGTLFPISFTVHNQGAGNPNNYYWSDGVYLSNSPNGLGENAVKLTDFYHYNGLAPNAEYTKTENITLPSSLQSGTYYLYVVADCYNNVFEYIYEDNNIVRGATQVTVSKPDLLIEEIIAPDTLTAGYPFTISYVLKNAGEGTIENWNIRDKISVSVHENLSYQTLLDYVTNDNLNLQPGQTKNVNYSGTVPIISEGTYYLYLRADSDNSLNESNEYNNHLTKYPVFIAHRPLPDLVPISLTLPNPVNAGTDVQIAFDVANIGEMDLLDANCNINVYASKYNYDYYGYWTLCPMQSQSLPLGGPNISIMAGDTLHFVRTISIPPTINAEYTFFKLVVNDNPRYVDELNENNNTLVLSNVTVHDCPLPDLVVSSIEVPTSMQVGVTNQVSFYVKNVGELALQNSSLDFAIQAVVEEGIECPIQALIEPQPNSNISLPVGDSIHVVMNFLISPMVPESCSSMAFVVNPNGNIIEANETNNATTTTVNLTHYPFDLQLLSMSAPNALLGGRTYQISWTVKNIGTCPSSSIPMYVEVEDGFVEVTGENLPTPWTDKVYFSNDNILSDDDVELTAFNRTTVLNPNGTYTVTQSFVAPYAIGSKYIICNSDDMQTTYDYNRNNNKSIQAVTVEYGTLPDLSMTAIIVDDVLTSGDPYWIHYTVTNQGENATLVDAWTDAFYVGRFNGNLNNNASIVGSKVHNGILEAGASYTDSVQVTPPNGWEGNYYFMGFTDATDLVFENNNENNNVTSLPVCLVKPLPCDLIVIGIEHPEEAESGENLTVSWQVNNIGTHAASGIVRDAVYLSDDDEWSSDDVMLGYMESNVNIPAYESLPRELTARVQGVPEGDYHVIVKTNIQYALNETTYENNASASMTEITVDYPILDIGESIARTLDPGQTVYYRIVVGPEYAGQTLSCRLNTTSLLCMNKLYVAYEGVPTLASFDFGASTPMQQELEILIPTLNEGSYYVLVTGTNSENQPQNITLAASIVNFEILHVDTDHGSNTGSITTQIIGAKFDTIMDFRLVQGSEYLPAEKVFFTNSTESYATFNLTDMPTGSYSMVAELPGGIITIKDEAFQIEEGLPAELMVNIIVPSSVRVGNTFTCTIEYGNYGSTDLNVSGFMVASNYPIAFTADELALNQTDITFMTAEGHGNPDVLRPGYFNTKTVFVNAVEAGNAKIHVYAIRRQY